MNEYIYKVLAEYDTAPAPTTFITHIYLKVHKHLLFFFFFFFFGLFTAIPAAYGGSRARGLIGAIAASLHHSHSNVGSKPHLQPIPQLTAMPDP